MLKKIRSWLMSARTTKSIAITLGTLSLFVLIASLAACSVATAPTLSLIDQSAFKVRDLAVSPVTVNKGEAVTISANVINTSGSDGSYNAELRINNANVASKTLTISAGVTQALNFIVPTNSPGIYEAAFGGLTGTFTVVADNSAKVIQASNITSSNSVPAAAPSCCDTSQTAATGSAAAPSCCAFPATTTTPNAPTLPKASGGCCGR